MKRSLSVYLIITVYIFLLCASVIFWDIAKWVSIPVFLYTTWLLVAKKEDAFLGLPIGLWPASLCNCFVFLLKSIDDKWAEILSIMAGLIIVAVITVKEDDKKKNAETFFFKVMVYLMIAVNISIMDNSYLSLLVIPLMYTIFLFFLDLLMQKEKYVSRNPTIAAVVQSTFFFLFLFFIHTRNTRSDVSQVEIQTDSDTTVVAMVLEKEKQIKGQMNQNFLAISENKGQNDNISPEFSLKSTIESGKRIWTAEYSYTTNSTRNEAFEDSVFDYDPGEYHYDASPAAFQMLKSVDYSLQYFLKTNLEEGEEVQIELHGYSDGLQFKRKENPARYDGRMGNFSGKGVNGSDKVVQYVLNEFPVKGGVELHNGDLLNNENLAFLRAYCMKQDYLANVVPLRNVLAKTQYTFAGHTQAPTNQSDPRERKVKIVLRIVNPVPNKVAVPVEMKTEKVDYACGKWMPFISKILLGLLVFLLGYHYKRYHEKKDKKENARKERNILAFTFVTGIILLLLIYLWCPSSFWQIPDILIK